MGRAHPLGLSALWKTSERDRAPQQAAKISIGPGAPCPIGFPKHVEVPTTAALICFVLSALLLLPGPPLSVA